MTAFYDFKKELDVRARMYSEHYMLEYMTTLLKNLALTIPGVEERVQQEAVTLLEFNIKDGYSKPTSNTADKSH